MATRYVRVISTFCLLAMVLVLASAAGANAGHIAPSGESSSVLLPLGAPTVDGLFSGDEVNYFILGSADGDRGTLYNNRVGNTLYLLMRVDPSVNDNVFGDKKDAQAEADLISAGWTTGSGGAKEHRFDQLETSDNVEMVLTCGSNSWTWHQGYLYQDGTEWKSDHLDNSIGGGTPPPNTVSHSSLEWNVEHTTWDFAQGSTDHKDWRSPSGNPGYAGFDSINKWEWAMVYEMSMDVSACGTNDIVVYVPSAHNSPPKDGTEDVPVCTSGCTICTEGGTISAEVTDTQGQPLQGFTVSLYLDLGTVGTFEPGTDLLLDTKTTDSQGLASFPDQGPRNYVLQVLDQGGYTFDRNYAFVTMVCLGGAGVEPFEGHVPTAVTLAGFSAYWDADAVVVEWETAAEINHIGFNVWRALHANGRYRQVNESIIPAQGLGGVTGASYTFVDDNVMAGTTYYYRLESVGADGTSDWSYVATAEADSEPEVSEPPPGPPPKLH